MVRVTYCMRRQPHVTSRHFVAWCTKNFIPDIVSIPLVTEKVHRLVVSYTSSLQGFGIPQRRYDALVDWWFYDLDDAMAVFTNPALCSIKNNADANFTAESRCHWIITEEMAPIFNGEVSNRLDHITKLKFTTLLTRNAAMSFEQFVKHHKERHIELFSSIPIIQRSVIRYTVSHRLTEAARAFPDMKYDGIVEFWFNNAIDMISVFLNPAYLSKVRPDERRFLELSKCDFVISEELPPIIAHVN